MCLGTFVSASELGKINIVARRFSRTLRAGCVLCRLLQDFLTRSRQGRGFLRRVVSLGFYDSKCRKYERGRGFLRIWTNREGKGGFSTEPLIIEKARIFFPGPLK